MAWAQRSQECHKHRWAIASGSTSAAPSPTTSCSNRVAPRARTKSCPRLTIRRARCSSGCKSWRSVAGWRPRRSCARWRSSCTAPRSPPTRCSPGASRARVSSPHTDFATRCRCAAVCASRSTTTSSLRRRRWCRGACACPCAGASGTTAARSRHFRSRTWTRRSTPLARSRWRRWRSASCTHTPMRRTSGRRPNACRGACPMSTFRSRAWCCRRCAFTSAPAPLCSTRWSVRSCDAIWTTCKGGSPSPGSPGCCA